MQSHGTHASDNSHVPKVIQSRVLLFNCFDEIGKRRDNVSLGFRAPLESERVGSTVALNEERQAVIVAPPARPATQFPI